MSGLQYNYLSVIGKGSVYDIKGGKRGLAFYYSVQGANKIRKVITGNSDEENREKAIKFLDEIERQCEAVNKVVHNMELTFFDVSTQWFEEYKARRNDEENKISYASVESRYYSLQKINKHIGNMLVTDIDNDVAKNLIKICSKKEDGSYYSESHVDKLQQAFRMVMKYAKSKNYCNSVPDKVELSKFLTKPDKDSRFLDEEELAVIFDIVEKNIRYKTIVHLLATSGLRQEEAFALNINDFHVRKNGMVEVVINKTVVETEGHIYKIVYETKTDGSRRKLNIPYDVYVLVKEYYEYVIENETQFQSYLRELNKLEGYIFLNKNMCPINKRTFERNFKDYLIRNGKSDFDFDATLHMFRHSYVSLNAENLSLEEIALIIGDSIETTHKIYQSITNNAKNNLCKSTSNFYNRLKRK